MPRISLRCSQRKLTEIPPTYCNKYTPSLLVNKRVSVCSKVTAWRRETEFIERKISAYRLLRNSALESRASDEHLTVLIKKVLERRVKSERKPVVSARSRDGQQQFKPLRSSPLTQSIIEEDEEIQQLIPAYPSKRPIHELVDDIIEAGAMWSARYELHAEQLNEILVQRDKIVQNKLQGESRISVVDLSNNHSSLTISINKEKQDQTKISPYNPANTILGTLFGFITSKVL